MLSGGASPGTIRVEMLHALYERCIIPRPIVGTSIGAIKRCPVSVSRPPSPETTDELAKVWQGPHRFQASHPPRRRGLLSLPGGAIT